jgi:serine/threonine protein kinase
VSDFELGKEVGSGKFGDVYLCKHKRTGMLFALKKIFKSVIREYRMEEQFALELKILYHLDHPNIVKLYSHFSDEYHVFLLMEYLEGGELLARMGSSEEYVAQTISQMIEAVDYMHGMGVVHRDIKPENIVLAFDVSSPLLRKQSSCATSAGPGSSTTGA